MLSSRALFSLSCISKQTHTDVPGDDAEIIVAARQLGDHLRILGFWTTATATPSITEINSEGRTVFVLVNPHVDQHMQGMCGVV